MTSPTEDEKLAAEGWIKHDGKGMPVDGKERVLALYSDGEQPEGLAERWIGWDWSEEDRPYNHITHYRVVSPNTDRAQVEALGKMADVPDAMTLRDQFAVAALPTLVGVMMNPANRNHVRTLGKEQARKMIAEELYEIADAMLAERAKK